MLTSPKNAAPEQPGDGNEARAHPPSSRSARRLLAYPWVIVGVLLVAFSTGLLLWARTSPGFDPYGWLVWGYQTLRLNLNLGGAPSWKPVTFLFTVPYSIFGHLSYWLWMVTAISIALAGPIFAGRIVYKVVLDSSEERWAAIVGAVFAGLCLLGIVQYTHYWLSAQSDPMLVTFFLAAVDMHLHRRPRWALAFLWLSSLGRPETWPFLALYSIWIWREIPKTRRLVVGAWVLLAFFWFGVPVLSGNSPFVAGQLAENSPRMLHSGKIIGTIDRFRALTYWPVKLAAGIGVLLALWRRNRVTLVIAGMSALWMVIEVAFALHGFPGVPRYMFEAAGAMIVVAGIGVGWLLTEFRRFSRLAQLAGVAGVVALVGFSVPGALAQEHYEHKDLIHERARTAEIHRLDATIKALGGYKFIRSCGDPTSDVEYVSVLAWYTKLDVGYVGHRPEYMITDQTKPLVLFTALFNGWIVHTYHQTAKQPATCSRLNGAYWIVTPQRPGGFLGHQT